MIKEKVIHNSYVKKNLPTRTKLHNKTHGGKLLIVGGSEGMYGAAILSSLAATRSGSGYTYVLMDWKNSHLLKHPDLLFLNPKTDFLKKVKPTAMVLGPGLGRSIRAEQWLSILAKETQTPAVLDADGLYWLAHSPERSVPSSWILTPHEGELARLLNVTSHYVQMHPMECVLRAQKKWKCCVLLKGANTLITDGETLLHCKTGTPALAKAGTGDVLSGLIGAMLAQGKNPLTAAALGTYIHGLASSQWMKKGNDVLSLRPLDLIEQLPLTLKSLRR